MGKIFKHKLTRRQKEILERTKLPNNWEELSTYHRIIIKRIEKMIKYLEKKYGKKFYYKGYIPENKLFFDKESLLVYAEGDDPEVDCFAVEPKGFGFTDEYAWVIQTPIVQKEMEEKLAGIFEGQNYKMFVELTGVSDEGVVEAFSTTIYIDNSDSVVTDSIMEKIVSIISDEPRYCKIYMYSFKKPVVDQITTKEHNRSFDTDDVKSLYMSTPIDRREGKGWRRNDWWKACIARTYYIYYN